MTATVLMQQLSTLYNEQLFSSLEMLSGFFLTMIKNNSSVFEASHRYEILIFHGDAKFECRQYQKAESLYKLALQIRKDILKQCTKSSSTVLHKLPSELDVKYKIHLCYCALSNNDSAISILEGIPVKFRTLKIHYALAKIYHEVGMDRSAITSYKEVLKKCPFAIDAILNLVALGESPSDFLSLLSNATHCLDWLLTLIKADSFLLNREYQKSLSAFDVLNKKSSIAGDVRVVASLARAHARAQNNVAAIQYFENARMIDPLLLDGLGTFAYLLHEEDEHTKLDSLATQLFSISEFHPAPWVALGYRAYFKGDFKQVIYLTVQATKLDSRCVQAILLKGTALRSMEETKDAIAHFREALRIDPYWFCCYSELVWTYLPQNKNKEALAVAHNALKTIGFRTNCLSLCASVHMRNPSTQEKAHSYLEKALMLDPNSKYPISVKASVLYNQKEYREVVKFLTVYIDQYASSPMHTTLANSYLELKNFPKAVEHYTIALSLNPNNKEAEEGMNKITTMQQEPYDENALDANDSGQNASVVDIEEGNSDSDIMWTE